MKKFTTTLGISFRDYGGAYHASALGVRCSSTNSARIAAEGVAMKFAKLCNVSGKFTLKEVGKKFIAEWIKEAA